MRLFDYMLGLARFTMQLLRMAYGLQALKSLLKVIVSSMPSLFFGTEIRVRVLVCKRSLNPR